MQASGGPRNSTPGTLNKLFFEAVDGYARRLKSSLFRLENTFFSEMQTTRLHRAVHSARANFPNNIEPVAAHISFPANKRDFACAQARKLAHKIEALRGRELVRTPSSGARSTMLAL